MAWAQAQARLPQRGFRSSSDSGSKRCQRRLLTAASAGGKGEGAGSRTRQLWVKTRSKETFIATDLSCSGNLCRHVYPSEDLLAENGDAEAQRTLVPSYYVVLA